MHFTQFTAADLWLTGQNWHWPILRPVTPWQKITSLFCQQLRNSLNKLFLKSYCRVWDEESSHWTCVVHNGGKCVKGVRGDAPAPAARYNKSQALWMLQIISWTWTEFNFLLPLNLFQKISGGKEKIVDYEMGQILGPLPQYLLLLTNKNKTWYKRKCKTPHERQPIILPI